MGWEPHRPEIIQILETYPLKTVNTKEGKQKIQQKIKEKWKDSIDLKDKILWKTNMTPFGSYREAEHYIIHKCPKPQIAIPYTKHFKEPNKPSEIYMLIKIEYIA